MKIVDPHTYMIKPLEADSSDYRELLRIIAAYQKAIDFNIICSATDTQGRIIYVNKRFCDVSKYTEDELLGQNHSIVNSSYHPPEFFQNLWNTISHGEVWRGEINSKAKDGSSFWQDSTILPIFDDCGQIIQYFSLRLSIDERKKVEQEKIAYLEDLEKVLFMCSHKVRQPIVQIMGLANILEEKMHSPAELHQLLLYIKQAALSLDEYTRELTVFLHNIKPAKQEEE